MIIANSLASAAIMGLLHSAVTYTDIWGLGPIFRLGPDLVFCVPQLEQKSSRLEIKRKYFDTPTIFFFSFFLSINIVLFCGIVCM